MVADRPVATKWIQVYGSGMCNVCIASAALSEPAGALIRWRSNPSAAAVRVQVKPGVEQDVEGPGLIRIKREGARWGSWVWVDDLAGAVALYGFDVKWRCVPEATRRWLTVVGSKPPSYRRLVAAAHRLKLERRRQRAITHITHRRRPRARS